LIAKTQASSKAAEAQTSLQEGWQVVRFEQMAENITDRVDNPSEADVEYYVGLEHLDPESLKIRRWGTPDDVEATKLRFKPGDIIFGRRRAYQRKLAVADFEGICSAHALVLRAREETVIKDFLPFFMQSETFFQRALAISVGSLSPTINWKTLAVQEFAIPPKAKQRRIAEILWAADEVEERFHGGLEQTKALKRQLLAELTTRGIGTASKKETKLGEIPAHWTLVEVGDILAICQYGLSIPLNGTGQIPIFRMMNIVDGVVVENDMKYADLSETEIEAYKLAQGDILFNRTNSADLVGKVGIYLLDGIHAFASYLVRLRAQQDEVLPEYLNYFLNSELGQNQILSYATPGVSQTNINASNLKKVLVPLPPLQEQSRIVGVLEQFDTAKESLTRHLAQAHELKRQLLSSLLTNGFGGR